MTTLLLAALFLIIDVLGYSRWAFVFVVLGVNSIAIYMMAHMFDFRLVGNVFVGGVSELCAPEVGNFVQAVGRFGRYVADHVLDVSQTDIYQDLNGHAVRGTETGSGVFCGLRCVAGRVARTSGGRNVDYRLQRRAVDSSTREIPRLPPLRTTSHGLQLLVAKRLVDPVHPIRQPRPGQGDSNGGLDSGFCNQRQRGPTPVFRATRARRNALRST